MVVPGAEKSDSQSQATDNATAEDAISKHLAAFNEKAVDESITPAEETIPEPKDEDKFEDEDTPKDEDESAEAEPDESEEEAVEDDDDDDSTPTLPAALQRTAKRYGWSDEEISDALKTSFSGTVKTFEKLHASANAMTSEWADLGRKKKAEDEAAASAAVSETKPVTRTMLDEDALIEKYGEDRADLIRELVGPVKQVMQELKPLAEQVQASQEFIATAEEEASSRKVQAFFTADEMKPFAKHYGTLLESMTDEQYKNRNDVLELADAMIVGAGQQGRVLESETAMLLAHDSLTAKMQEDAIRDGLKKKAKNRGDGVTLKPSHQGRTAGASTGPAKDEAELEARTLANMRRAFG